MKNKHLLLIFLCTLLLGLLAKYAPWFKSDIFQTDLVRVDAADVQRISIMLPGKPELVLEHSDEGWVASQDDFAVRTADSAVVPILAALAPIRSLRIVHTDRRDTLLLLPSQAIHVEVHMKNGRKEMFEIGLEILEGRQPATYIEIDKHEGVYLTDQHLRRVFTRSVDDFRNKKVLSFSPSTLRAVSIVRPGIDTLFFQKSDTSTWWHSNRSEEMMPPEQVQQWMQSLQRLNDLPFAAHSDESDAAEKLVAKIELEQPDSQATLLLQIFDAKGNFYFTKRADRAPVRQTSPAFVVQSSQNAFNFFALADTLLAHKIWTGPVGQMPQKR